MLNVASANRLNALKQSQAQSHKLPSSNDRPQGAFESMLDDNASQAAASNKDAASKDQANAPDRNKAPDQSAKTDKADKTTTESKPSTEKPQQAATDEGQKADQTTTPAGDLAEAVIDAGAKVEGEGKEDGDTKTKDAASETDADKPATDNPQAVPAGPVQTVIVAQTPQPEVKTDAPTTDETSDAPVLAVKAGTVSKEQPELKGKADADALTTPTDTSTPKPQQQQVEKTPADIEKLANGQQAETTTAAKQPAQTELSHEDKQHIARARGEDTDGDKNTALRADSATPSPTASTDVTAPPTQPATHAATQTPAPAATQPTASSQANNVPVAVPLASVGVEIASKAVSGKNNFEIRLDPAELGRIEVRLHVDKDGNVTTQMIADRQDTLDLLKRDSSGLERALQDAGLKTSDNGMQFSLRDQSMGQGQENAGQNGKTAHIVVPDETPANTNVDIPMQTYGRLGGRLSGLDIRV